jgi:hypothetical protein
MFGSYQLGLRGIHVNIGCHWFLSSTDNIDGTAGTLRRLPEPQDVNF